MDFKSKQVILNMSFAKRLTLAIGFMALITVQSCTPDDEEVFEEDTKTPPAYTYKATINGKSWEGKQNLSLLVKDSTGTPGKQMRISANSTDGKLLTLTLNDFSTGVSGDGIAFRMYIQSANGSGDASFELVDTEKNATYTGAYGTVVVNGCDAVKKTITGKFDATLYGSSGDSVKITFGVFGDLPYSIAE